MDFENFKEKFMEDIKERLEDAGIDANITTNTVKKLNESYEAVTITPNDSKRYIIIMYIFVGVYQIRFVKDAIIRGCVR